MDTKTQLQIKTTNPNDSDIITFEIMNPTTVQISSETIEKLEKTQAGYNKISFGTGLHTLVFSGTMPIYSENEKTKIKTMILNNDVASENYYWNSPVVQWFSNFHDYVYKNNRYSFYISFFGTMTNLSIVNNPIFKGTMKPPSYNRDANDPFKLQYNFTFTGILLNEYSDDPFVKNSQQTISTDFILP